MMTIADLIEELEQFSPDTEVRLAIQPTYPFQHTIASVVEDTEQDEPVVYIAEAGQHSRNPYLPGTARDALGW